ncbi:MAG TPA: helix-turn-helix transcriptional regulator [Solirubrobacterales bacterium]|nr:helix-turn-helix transcriptional regulator [Solirubrobacterales bacterium]
MRLLGKFIYLSASNHARTFFGDLAARFSGGRRLRRDQRAQLLRDLRLELEVAVEEAEEHAISDGDAEAISHIRSLIRWLEDGEVPGPEAIPFLEGRLATFYRRQFRRADPAREALIAGIYELGGNGVAAAGIYRKADREFLWGFGRALHRSMNRAGLTVDGLARRAGLEPSEVVVFLHGTEQPRLDELVRLAQAVGVDIQALADGALKGASERPGSDAGLNDVRPEDDDEVKS